MFRIRDREPLRAERSISPLRGHKESQLPELWEPGFKLAPAIGDEVGRPIMTGTSELLRPFRLNRTFDPASELHPR
jgi:hypothetical protein